MSEAVKYKTFYEYSYDSKDQENCSFNFTIDTVEVFSLTDITWNFYASGDLLDTFCSKVFAIYSGECKDDEVVVDGVNIYKSLFDFFEEDSELAISVYRNIAEIAYSLYCDIKFNSPDLELKYRGSRSCIISKDKKEE